MRKTIFIAAILLAITIPVFAEQFRSTATVDVFFSLNGGATDAIVRELNAAKTEILVQSLIKN